MYDLLQFMEKVLLHRTDVGSWFKFSWTDDLNEASQYYFTSKRQMQSLNFLAKSNPHTGRSHHHIKYPNRFFSCSIFLNAVPAAESSPQGFMLNSKRCCHSLLRYNFARTWAILQHSGRNIAYLCHDEYCLLTNFGITYPLLSQGTALWMFI